VVVFPELSLTGYELDAEPVSPSENALRPIVEAAGETGSVSLVGAPVEEQGRWFIAALRIDGSGATRAYRKSHLGGDELDRFNAGDGPTVIKIDGWRLGMGICKDTGISEHTAGTAKLNIDVYIAGLVHLLEELEEQDARGQRIAAVCRSYIAFASFAGPTSGGYDSTAASQRSGLRTAR